MQFPITRHAPKTSIGSILHRLIVPKATLRQGPAYALWSSIAKGELAWKPVGVLQIGHSETFLRSSSGRMLAVLAAERLQTALLAGLFKPPRSRDIRLSELALAEVCRQRSRSISASILRNPAGSTGKTRVGSIYPIVSYRIVLTEEPRPLLALLSDTVRC